MNVVNIANSKLKTVKGKWEIENQFNLPQRKELRVKTFETNFQN